MPFLLVQPKGDHFMDRIDTEFQAELKSIELREMLERADNAVAIAVGTTAATGFVPIPFADAPLLIAQQVTLMATICGIFKINIKKDGLTALATAALSASGATIIGKTVATNLMKLIPGAGTAAGGAISSGTAGIITLAMGKAFIEVCKAAKMGILSEADITSIKGKQLFKDAFKKQIKIAKKK